MRKLIGFCVTLAAVAATLSATIARGGSCAAYLGPDALGGMRVSGWAEMRDMSTAWIVDAEGALLQIIPFRVDPIAPAVEAIDLLPPMHGLFSARADFTVFPMAVYRMLVVQANGLTTCVAWFTAPTSATECQASMVRVRDGGWLVTGTTRVRGAAWVHVTDDGGEVVQIIPVLYDPIAVDSLREPEQLLVALPMPVGRFNARATFDVKASEYFDAVVVDSMTQTLCIDRLEFPSPSLQLGEGTGTPLGAGTLAR